MHVALGKLPSKCCPCRCPADILLLNLGKLAWSFSAATRGAAASVGLTNATVRAS